MRILALALSLLAATASGQAIQQSGSVTPGHALQWVTTGVAKDAGSAANGSLTELGVTKAGGNAICVNSGPVSAAYQALCLGASTTGGGTISLQKFGTAPAEPLSFVVNGVTALQLTSATGGFATVNGTPVTNNCAKFVGATIIADAGTTCGGTASIGAYSLYGNNTGSSAAPAGLTRLQSLSLLGLMANAVAEGADPTGIADSTSALNAAFATCAAYIPPGTYKTTSALTTGSCTNTTIIGGGAFVTTINVTSTTAKGFVNSATSGSIGGFTLTRTGTPTSAGTGFDFSTLTNNMRIYSVISQNNYVGFLLGTTAFGEIADAVAQNNYNDGIQMSNIGGGAPIQWNVTKVLSQKNNGIGFHVIGTGTGGIVTMGPWINAYTFANTGGGMWFVGASGGANLEGIYIADSQANSDGNDGMYFQTYGVFQPVQVTNSVIADTGFTATGRNQATAASHTGQGVRITTSNLGVNLTNLDIDFNSLNGIAVDGDLSYFSFSDIYASNNGTAAGNMYDGLNVSSTTSGTVAGGFFGNPPANETQRYGMNFADATGITVVGGVVSSNATDPVNVASGVLQCFGLQGYGSCTGGGSGSSVTFQNSTVASASTTNLAAGGTNLVTVTGNATITSFGSGASTANPVYEVIFSGTPTIVNSGSLGTTVGADIVVRSGDRAWLHYTGSGNWTMDFYQRFGGDPLSTFGAQAVLASATTTDLGTADSEFVAVSGTTTITSFGSSATTYSPLYVVKFQAALTLTNSGSLALPGGANITTAANDTALAQYTGSGNWRVLGYFPAAGGTSTSLVNFQNSSIASAGTTDIGSTGTNLVTVTGNATITSLGGSASTTNPVYELVFSGTPLLTNSGALALTGGTNIQVRSGDRAWVHYTGAGNWTMDFYQRFTADPLSVWGAKAVLASASTVDLATANSEFVEISGTTGVTSFGSSALTINPLYMVKFQGVLTLTNSGALALPGGGNITTAANDSLLAQYLGSGNWRVLAYFPAAGSGSGTVTSVTAGSNLTGGTITTSGTLALSANPSVTTLTSSSTTTAGYFIANGSAVAGLDLTGGTWSGGAALLGNDTSLIWKNNAGTNTIGMFLHSDDALYIGAGGGGNATTIFEEANTDPALDNTYSIGEMSKRWTAVWATNGIIQTSDRRSKNILGPETLGLDFIERLNPVEYTWKDRPNGVHHGVVAQELETALAGRPFAGLVKPANDNGRYGLNYDELVAPLIKSVQELSVQVKALQAANVNLRQQVKALQPKRVARR